MLPYFGAAVLAVIILVAAVIAILLNGPSAAAGRLFVLSCRETSALKWLPELFASEARLETLVSANSAEFSLYPAEDGSSVLSTDNTAESISADAISSDDNGITLIDIHEDLFKGKLMIVSDPAKVCIGALDRYGSDVEGLYLYEFIEKYDAIAGTNAGGFYDPNGYGNGGIPDGLVIIDGEIRYGSADIWYNNIIVFDDEHILHVGSKTAAAALAEGITSAVSFAPGPVLVSDGVMQTGLGGGINPRTCIGQREDGTVLILVLEGRKPDSLGATYDDLAEIMFSYGAVNAANLDGGSSSLMYYNGEQITRGSNIVGMRKMSTSILVLK